MKINYIYTVEITGDHYDIHVMHDGKIHTFNEPGLLTINEVLFNGFPADFKDYIWLVNKKKELMR